MTLLTIGLFALGLSAYRFPAIGGEEYEKPAEPELEPFERLAEIKGRQDPGNRFRLNNSIPPVEEISRLATSSSRRTSGPDDISDAACLFACDELNDVDREFGGVIGRGAERQTECGRL